MAIVTLCKNVVFCIIYIMHKDDEETIIDNDPHLMIFQLTRSFQYGFGYFKLCTCIQGRCGFYSLRSYTSNLVKITLVVSEAENTKNGRKQVAIVHLSDLVDLKTS